MGKWYGSSRATRISRGEARSDDATPREEEFLPVGAMSGMAWVRLLVGAVWLLAGLEKLLNPRFPKLFDAVLETGGFIKDAPAWLQWFINSYVVPNSGSFAVLVGAGETVIGIGLVLGLLTNLSAVGGVFLGLTFVVDLGGLSIGTGLGSPGIFTLQVMVALLCLIVLLSPGAKAASVDKMLADRSPRLSSLLLGPKGPSLGGMTGMAWVRLLLGALWLNGGLEKLLNPGFPKLFDAVLQTGGYIDQGPPPFEAFMRQFVVPNAELVAVLSGLGETAIGVGLLLGFVTNLVAAGSIVMSLGLLTSLGGLSIGTGLGASGLLPFHMLLALVALVVLLSPGAKAASVDGMLADRSPRLALLLLSARRSR
jgi:thiosulfate dehydrogenase (quinone) large subunit